MAKAKKVALDQREQAAMDAFLAAYKDGGNRSPRLKDVAVKLGKSMPRTSVLLRTLQDKGHIVGDPGRYVSLRPVA